MYVFGCISLGVGGAGCLSTSKPRPLMASVTRDSALFLLKQFNMAPYSLQTARFTGERWNLSAVPTDGIVR